MVNILSSLLATSLVGIAIGETVHGVVVFSRHGDRTTKHFKGYRLTDLGAQQVYSSGSLYRDRYISSVATNPILGVSSDVWQSKQIYASAPDQEVLLNTGTAFLQGLYPPAASASAQELVNGSSSEAPLGGYQYVVLHSELANSPDTIWLKGADSCPAYTKSAASYNTTDGYKTLINETYSFYQQFDGLLSSLYPDTTIVSYANAYDIFDLLNVASIHNATVAKNINTEQLDQLRYLADISEFNRNYSPDDSIRSIGGQTFATAVLSQLNQTVMSNATLKFSLLTGSYDTFLSFAGLTNLTLASNDFYGLPDYASTMAFEMFTSDNVTTFPSTTDSLKVRFMFRNGSASDLNTFALFGGAEEELSYSDFVSKMSKIAINKVSEWCSQCGSAGIEAFCPSTSAAPPSLNTVYPAGSHLSNAAAGGIGAGVTLGVVLLCFLAFLAFKHILFKKRTPVGNIHRSKDLEVASSAGSH